MILFHTDIYRKSWIISSYQLTTSRFGGIALVILVDLLNDSTAVEGVTIFLAVDMLSEDLDGIFGNDVIVGIGNPFLFIAGVYWKAWFSSISVFSSICFSSHSVVFKCALMWSHVLLSFWLDSFILHQYEWGLGAGSRITAGFHILSSVSKHHTVCPGS